MDEKVRISGCLGIKYWFSMGWATPSWNHISSLLRGLVLFTQETRIPIDGVDFPSKLVQQDVQVL